MKTRAAVAFAANQPLEIVELDLERDRKRDFESWHFKFY